MKGSKEEKIRIDKLLVLKGLVKSRTLAESLVLEGKVFVNKEKIEKPSQFVILNSNIFIEEKPLYVSRGGYKLEKAIDVFNINVKDKIAMDIGASTGGFTDCLLKHGASQVFAVDVGYGQIDYSLRNDKRVILLERTNAKNLKFSDLNEYVDIVTIDVSFISILKILPAIDQFLKSDSIIIALIKPQFEAKRGSVNRRGVVKTKEIVKSTIFSLKSDLEKLNFFVLNFTYSPIKGANGNIEYLSLLSKKEEKIDDNTIDKIIEESYYYFERKQE